MKLKYRIIFTAFIVFLFSCRQITKNPEEYQGALSSNTNLLTIGFSADVTGFSFGKNKDSYSVRLKDSDTEKIKVTAVAEDKDSYVTVEPAAETPITQGGAAVFKITVKAKSGDSRNYTVKVMRGKKGGEELSANAFLKSLKLSSGVLTSDFHKEKTNYTAVLEFEEEDTRFFAVPEDDNAVVQITEVPAGKVAAGGEKTVNIKVTAADGQTAKTYTVKVVRKADSEKAELLQIVLSTGEITPEFNPAVTEYICNLPNETDKITVKGIPLNGKAQVTVNPEGEQTLTAGVQTLFTLKVSLNGNTKTYTVKITRENPKDKNAKLSTLVLKDEYGDVYNLEPAFSPDTKEYSAKIPLNKDGHLSAEGNVQQATSVIAGVFVSPAVLAQEAGAKQKIRIVTKAEAGNTETYTITAERTANPDYSNDASLKNLELQDIGGAVIPISPVFSQANLNYTAEVPFHFKKSLKAVYKINYRKASAVQTKTPEEFPQEGGAQQVIAVKVTAEDGSTVQSYTITVKRAAADTNNKLTKLELHLNGTTGTPHTITPSFNSDTLEYTAEVPQSTSYVKLVFAKASIHSIVKDQDGKETPTTTSTKDYKFDENPKVLELKVTAQNGDVRVYKVTVKSKVFDPKYLKMVTVTSVPVTVIGAGNEGVFIQGRTVEIKPYAMGECEITFDSLKHVAQWAKSNGYSFSIESFMKIKNGNLNEGDDQPATNVAWTDIIVWCNAYSKKEGREPVYTTDSGEEIKRASQVLNKKIKMDISKNGFRLPTEAEWEFAARGADPAAPDWNFKYAGTDTDPPDEFVWYSGNCKVDGNCSTHPPKQKKPTNYGKAGKPQIYDLSGNVAELCWDLYADIKPDTPATGPAKVEGNIKYRVRKGGSCFGLPTAPPKENTQIFKREYIRKLKEGDPQSGFRVVYSL